MNGGWKGRHGVHRQARIGFVRLRIDLGRDSRDRTARVRLRRPVEPWSTAVELRPGMVLAVDPLVWVPDVRGGGGVRIEDWVLITESGPHVLYGVAHSRRLLD